MKHPLIYRDWEITWSPKAIPLRDYDYDVTHKDYNGPEDGRCFACANVSEAIYEIDQREDE